MGGIGKRTISLRGMGSSRCSLLLEENRRSVDVANKKKKRNEEGGGKNPFSSKPGEVSFSRGGRVGGGRDSGALTLLFRKSSRYAPTI